MDLRRVGSPRDRQPRTRLRVVRSCGVLRGHCWVERTWTEKPLDPASTERVMSEHNDDHTTLTLAEAFAERDQIMGLQWPRADDEQCKPVEPEVES